MNDPGPITRVNYDFQSLLGLSPLTHSIYGLSLYSKVISALDSESLTCGDKLICKVKDSLARSKGLLEAKILGIQPSAHSFLIAL